MNQTTEPVRLRGLPALAVGTILQAIILASVGTPPLGIAGALATMLLFSIGGLEWARRHVTPTAAPYTDDGTPLVPARREDGAADLQAVLTVMLIVLVAVVIVVLVRLL